MNHLSSWLVWASCCATNPGTTRKTPALDLPQGVYPIFGPCYAYIFKQCNHDNSIEECCDVSDSRNDKKSSSRRLLWTSWKLTAEQLNITILGPFASSYQPCSTNLNDSEKNQATIRKVDWQTDKAQAQIWDAELWVLELSSLLLELCCTDGGLGTAGTKHCSQENDLVKRQSPSIEPGSESGWDEPFSSFAGGESTFHKAKLLLTTQLPMTAQLYIHPNSESYTGSYLQ